MNESVKWMDVKTWIKEMVFYPSMILLTMMLQCCFVWYLILEIFGNVCVDFVLFMLYVDGCSTVK